MYKEDVVTYNEKLCDERHAYMEAQVGDIKQSMKETVDVVRDLRDSGVRIIISTLSAGLVLFAGALITALILIWNMYHPQIQGVVQAISP